MCCPPFYPFHFLFTLSTHPLVLHSRGLAERGQEEEEENEQHYSAFAFDERVEIFGSVAETVMYLCFTHDFCLRNSLKCAEMVCETIFYKFREVVQIVVMC